MASSASTARAISFLTERAEDAAAAVKGLLGSGGGGISGATSSRYLDSAHDDVGDIRTQLESNRGDDARLDALRRTVALISRGRDASSLLPSVLKLTSSQNLDVKRLVYIVVLRYSHRHPDMALLSINSFQKDLHHQSPLIRGMALRVLSSIRVPIVANLVQMAVTKAARDPNFYVRKIAAMAIPKCWELASSTHDGLLASLDTLLADRSPTVIGTALLSFSTVCPDNWLRLHAHYRKIAHALADLDEWSQPNAIETLARYARACLAPPTTHESNASESSSLDQDLQLLLDQAQPLLSSSNAAVVLAVVRLNLYIAPPSYWARIVHPLLRLARDGDATVAYLGLQTIRHLVCRRARASRAPDFASQFRPHVARFVPRSSVVEPSHMTMQKLHILIALAVSEQLPTPDQGHGKEKELRALGTGMSSYSSHALSIALGELAEHARHSPDDEVALVALDGLAKLCRLMGNELRYSATPRVRRASVRAAERCFGELLSLIRNRGVRPKVAARAVNRLRVILQARRDNTGVLDSVKAPEQDRPLLDLAEDEAERTSDGAARGNDAAVEDASSMPSNASIVARLVPLLYGTEPAATSDWTARSVMGKGALLNASARASIFWLLGQHLRDAIWVLSPTGVGAGEEKKSMTLAETMAPDVLRKAAVNFSNEPRAARLQILTLSAKLLSFAPSTPTLGMKNASASPIRSLRLLHSYLLQLARYDTDFEVRDRGRFLGALCAGLVSELELSERAASDEVARTKAVEVSQPPPKEGIRDSPKVAEELREQSTSARGVRLRREQVMLILFEGKPSPSLQDLEDDGNGEGLDGTEAASDGLGRQVGEEDGNRGRAHLVSEQGRTRAGRTLGSLASVVERLVPGWPRAELLPWAEAAERPSNEVREPPTDAAQSRTRSTPAAGMSTKPSDAQPEQQRRRLLPGGSRPTSAAGSQEIVDGGVADADEVASSASAPKKVVRSGAARTAAAARHSSESTSQAHRTAIVAAVEHDGDAEDLPRRGDDGRGAGGGTEARRHRELEAFLDDSSGDDDGGGYRDLDASLGGAQELDDAAPEDEEYAHAHHATGYYDDEFDEDQGGEEVEEMDEEERLREEDRLGGQGRGSASRRQRQLGSDFGGRSGGGNAWTSTETRGHGAADSASPPPSPLAPLVAEEREAWR